MLNTVDTRLRKLFLVALVVGLLVFGSSMRMTAQVTTAGITGVVADPSGAVFAGVAVTATGESTGFTRSFVTGKDGRFRLLELPLGT
jgi:ATP/ADP translocase